MIKKLIFILTLNLVSLLCTAQIQNQIFGLTLGSATKATVYNFLKTNKFTFTLKENGEYCAEDVEYAGYKWDRVWFTFYYDFECSHRCQSATFSLMKRVGNGDIP